MAHTNRNKMLQFQKHNSVLSKARHWVLSEVHVVTGCEWGNEGTHGKSRDRMQEPQAEEIMSWQWGDKKHTKGNSSCDRRPCEHKKGDKWGDKAKQNAVTGCEWGRQEGGQAHLRHRETKENHLSPARHMHIRLEIIFAQIVPTQDLRTPHSKAAGETKRGRRDNSEVIPWQHASISRQDACGETKGETKGKNHVATRCQAKGSYPVIGCDWGDKKETSGKETKKETSGETILSQDAWKPIEPLTAGTVRGTKGKKERQSRIISASIQIAMENKEGTSPSIFSPASRRAKAKGDKVYRIISFPKKCVHTRGFRTGVSSEVLIGVSG